MNKTVRRTEYILAGLLIVFCVVFVLYNYGFEIYTYLWHVKNPEPISVGNLKITIPDDLVCKVTENEILEIIYMKNPLLATIYVRLADYVPGGNSPGLEQIEKSPCNIAGKDCINIKFKKDEAATSYVEEIYLVAEKAYISFQGGRNERKYLLELIEKLRMS
ncbi:MAG: hypothetical protein HY809_08050 [Nitrospirae bacterium]|nr:hypothetical protein [Nitrospirota bacterium]